MKPIHALALLLLLAACDNAPVNPGDEFDRKELLTGTWEELIIPAFSRLDSLHGPLLSAVEAFAAQPDETTLSAAKLAWEQLAFAWQRTLPYNFGPAETSFGTFQEDFGTFPVDTALLEQYLAAGDTSFANFDRDTRGLYGLEYLLFGGELGEVAGEFTGAEGERRRQYLLAAARAFSAATEKQLQDWTAYRESFLANSGTDAGSSVSALYNGLVASYEMLKNFKVGLPAGVRPGQTGPDASLAEAHFSGLSGQLAREHFTVVEAIWRGPSGKPGFEEYLQSVAGGPDLVASTHTQMATVVAAFDALGNASLESLLATNPAAVEALHTELQKLTRYLKSDMSSLLGISITYDSGDGD